MIHVQDNIEEICGLLNAGKVILLPTDTVWAVGCDATSEQALHRLFDIRERDSRTPQTILVDGFEMLSQFVPQIHPRVETLLTLHERPLTIVYPETKNLPGILRSNDHQVGIRLVRDPFCAELIALFGKPLMALSANQPDRPYPRYFNEISSGMIKAVDYTVKYRQDDRQPQETSIVATYDEDGQLVFLNT